MPSFRSVVIDGKPVLIPADPPAPPANPPLAALNHAYREADAERRDDTEDAVRHAASAMRNAFSGKAAMDRRMQKPLRPIVKG